MIQAFCDKFMSAKESTIAAFKAERPESYDDLFRRAIVIISDPGKYEDPDPQRITAIDHGQYSGTRLFVVASNDYQPSTFWTCKVSYGSCSGCDALEAIRGFFDEPPTDEEALGYWTLMLHMVQGLRLVGDSDE